MADPLAIFVRRIPLQVTSEDVRVLDGQSRICAWAFNQLKSLADDLRAGYARLKAAKHVEPGRRHAGLDESANEIGRVLYTPRGLRNLLPAMKADHPFLKAVHSSPLKNAALRLSRAIQSHQESRSGRRAGSAVQWPRFHRWSQNWFSLEYDEPGKGFSIKEGTLHLSLGANTQGKRLVLRIPLGETVSGIGAARNLRIIKEGRTYFAVVTLRRSLPAPKPIRTAVALDPNHKNFAYGVGTDGRAFEIQNLPGRRDQDRRIDQLKSKRDRCVRRSRLVEVVRQDQSVGRHWEPSRRWNKFDQAIKRAAEKMRDQTKHFLYTVANRLCRDYDLIGVGDYTPAQGDAGLGKTVNRAMKNRSLLGRFKPILLWVARRSGKSAEVFDETGTTRTCSEPACGRIVAGGIPPGIREWTCGHCRTTHLRDENAAKNGLARMLRARSLHLPCSGPVQRRCDWCFHPQGWREAVHWTGANANQTGCPASTGPAEETVANGPIRGVIAPDPRPA